MTTRPVVAKLTALDWGLLAISIPLSVFLATKLQVKLAVALLPSMGDGGPLAWVLGFLIVQVGLIGSIALCAICLRFVLHRRSDPN